MDSRTIIKMLKKDGWILKRISKSSHHQFKHPTKSGLVTVPHPKSDIPKKTLKSIKKQAGWI
jgi:predicted RNA binding protein YcfA (HicA-like mRNA interferase family)